MMGAMRACLLSLVLLVGCVEGGAQDLATDASAPRVDAKAEAAAETASDTAPEAAFEAGVDAGPCPSGQTLCGSSCTNTATDPDHCGSCTNKCVDGEHGTRACAAGKCTLLCTGSFQSCDGTSCGTDTSSDLKNCGACGKACSGTATADPTCVASTCGTSCKADHPSLGGACATFGGVYETHAGCGSGCNNGNAYASSACACPTGFTASPALPVRNDACGLRDASLVVCESAGAAAGTWGGAYALEDTTSCSTPCRVKNPRTSACTCPAGYDGLSLRTLLSSPTCGAVIGGSIVMCVHPTAALDEFGGAYEQDDPVSGGVGCRAANPRASGCSCPSGFTARALRTLVDSSAGTIGSQIFVCTR